MQQKFRRKHLLAVCIGCLVILQVGCATSTSGQAGETGAGEEAQANERRVPPEVTDHTVHRVEGPAVRPTVDVQMEFDGMRGIDRAGVETRVSQQTVRCYRAALHGSQGLEGSMVYEVVVMRSGFVVGSDVMSTGINHREMQTCVERTFERLRFDVNARDRPVYRVMVRLDFQRETVLPEDSPVQQADGQQ